MASKSFAARILPWLRQGPSSTTEFLESVPAALQYRAVSPASQTEAIIPHAENDKIFDIKYYPRDVVRNVSKTSEMIDASLAAQGKIIDFLQADGLRPNELPAWIPKRTALLDYDDGGYTH